MRIKRDGSFEVELPDNMDARRVEHVLARLIERICHESSETTRTLQLQNEMMLEQVRLQVKIRLDAEAAAAAQTQAQLQPQPPPTPPTHDMLPRAHVRELLDAGLRREGDLKGRLQEMQEVLNRTGADLDNALVEINKLKRRLRAKRK